jgi:hypothetical protein
MAQTEEDLSFLAFFLNEPVYLLPEEEPVFITRHEVEAEIAMKDEAVQEPGETAEDEKAGAPSTTLPVYEGQNRKAVLVLYHQPDSEQLAEGSKAFLQKILQAVNHEPDDVALCNWALLEKKESEVPDIYETLQSIDSHKMLVFGDLPLAWSMSHFFQKYHISEDADGRQLLQADDLLMIAQKRDLKVKLWESLQRLFK